MVLNLESQQTVLAAMVKAGKPMKAGEVAAAAGLDEKVVAKAMDELKKAGKIHSPKRCYYAPVEP